MKSSFIRALVGASVALLLVASLGLAKKTNTKTIQILYPTELTGGTTLKPGTYQVALNASSPSPQLAFYQNHRQVAETPVKLVTNPTKNDATEVQYDTAHHPCVITEIDFRGSNQRVLFENSGH